MIEYQYLSIFRITYDGLDFRHVLFSFPQVDSLSRNEIYLDLEELTRLLNVGKRSHSCLERENERYIFHFLHFAPFFDSTEKNALKHICILLYFPHCRHYLLLSLPQYSIQHLLYQLL